MTRRTITLTAPNGAKVRTVHSKRYFVVTFGEKTTEYTPGGEREFTPLETPVPVAHVAKRTNSAVAALAALNKHGRNTVVFGVSNDGEFKNQLTRAEVDQHAATEKANAAFAARVGNNGPARSLYY